MGAEAGVVEVVEGAAEAGVEDGASGNGEGVVFADGEAARVAGDVLDVQVVLELVVCDDFAGAFALVGEDASFEGGVGLCGAGCSLRGELVLLLGGGWRG